METAMGVLTLKGEKLHIRQLDLDAGSFAVEGLVSALQYTAAAGRDRDGSHAVDPPRAAALHLPGLRPAGDGHRVALRPAAPLTPPGAPASPGRPPGRRRLRRRGGRCHPLRPAPRQLAAVPRLRPPGTGGGLRPVLLARRPLGRAARRPLAGRVGARRLALGAASVCRGQAGRRRRRPGVAPGAASPRPAAQPPAQGARGTAASSAPHGAGESPSIKGFRQRVANDLRHRWHLPGSHRQEAPGPGGEARCRGRGRRSGPFGEGHWCTASSCTWG